MTWIFTGYRSLLHAYGAFTSGTREEFIRDVYRVHYGVIETLVGTLNNLTSSSIITQPDGDRIPDWFRHINYPINGYTLGSVILGVWNPTERFYKEYRRLFLDNSDILLPWGPYIRFRIPDSLNSNWIEYQTKERKLIRITKADFFRF